jgi:hypothetical protein
MREQKRLRPSSQTLQKAFPAEERDGDASMEIEGAK